MPSFRFLRAGCIFAAVALTSVSLVSGCRTKDGVSPPKKVTQPTLRFYVLGGAAGAIEPCGCVKDMLGGLDHLSAFVHAGKKNAPEALVVGAGPMFFAEPSFPAEARAQALMKAESMAEGLADLGLVAFSPGENDFGFGFEAFEKLREKAKVVPLLANAKGSDALLGSTTVTKGGVKIGLVGVGEFLGKLSESPGFELEALETRVASHLDRLRAEGVNLSVLLIAAPRGAALRLAEKFPSVSLVVVGKGGDGGEKNDEPFPPELLEKTLVVQAPNHLQGVVVIDYFVRDGSFSFADGSGLEARAATESERSRARELERRLKRWEASGASVTKAELDRAKAELASLTKKLAEKEGERVPVSGSYFLYDFQPVKQSMGSDSATKGRIDQYYRRVNEHNKVAFAERVPPPPVAGESRFVGEKVCQTCHAEEHAFWKTTSHAKAYATLSDANKEFNLDCVGCHVTGYDKPGGSTVTHVENLTNVQCETCHGPGEKHAQTADKALVTRVPSLTMCAESCHHSPHVGADWSSADALSKIVGPGHGR